MEHSYRLIDAGSTRQRYCRRQIITAKAWTAMLSLLLMLFAADALRAQNPAYSFASRIGSTHYEVVNDIGIDASDNMYVTGWFRGTVDFDPGPGTANLTPATPVVGGSGNDIFVASYDASGNYRWAFNVGGTPASGDNVGLSIVVDDSGNVVVSGLFVGVVDFNPGTGTATLSSPSWATFVARYNSAGNYLWAFKIGTYSNRNDVAIDANGNVVVVGTFSGTFDFDPGPGTANLTTTIGKGSKASSPLHMYVAKYSSSGAYQWAFKIGNAYAVNANAVDIDGNGNIYVTGLFGEFSSMVDFNPGTGTANLTGYGTFVAKYTTAGVFAWAFKLGATPAQTQQIAVDASGNVVLTGGFAGTIDFDPGSGTANLTGIGTANNIFVARYNSSGSYQWAFTPSLGSAIVGLSIDGSGDIYVTGGFHGINDFDPGSGTMSLPTDPTYNAGAFVASYTSTGVYRWAFSIASPLYGRGIASNGSGDIYLTGIFGNPSFIVTADFDPSEETASLTSAGGPDIFIAKYTDAPPLKRAIESNTTSNALQMSVAPNPFTNAFTFGHDGTAARIEVVDMMGRMVESRDVDGATEVTLGEELPTGAYIVRMTQGDVRRQVIVRKVR